MDAGGLPSASSPLLDEYLCQDEAYRFQSPDKATMSGVKTPGETDEGTFGLHLDGRNTGRD